MENSEVTTLKAPPMEATASMPMPRIGVRGYRSIGHLWAARRAARETRRLEDERAGTKVPSIEVEAAATNAVLLSVAFIEAFVNEVLQDIAETEDDRLSARCEGIDNHSIKMIKAVWLPPVRLERASVLDKYQVALTVSSREPLDKGSNPYQAATKLIELRNALVHFKPEWQMDDEEHRLEKKLGGLFARSRIFSEPVYPWYPAACLASGCADWAHTSALALASEWRLRMGLTWPHHFDLTTLPRP